METTKFPNWRKKQDYEYLKKFTPNQWAWEFLRRNPEYVRDWEIFQSEPIWNEDGQLKKGAFTLSFKWGIDGLLKDPAKILNDKKDDPDYGIGFDSPGGNNTITMGMTESEKEYLYWGLPNFETGRQHFEFNFFEPIEPQLKIAKKMLLKLQKRAAGRKAFKPRPDEWVELLRVLDARAEGTKDQEIADVLFPDQISNDIYAGLKKVYDKYKQAKKYVDHDYRLIPYSEI